MTKVLGQFGVSTSDALQADDRKIAKRVKKCCVFRYWFNQANSPFFYPSYDGAKLYHGNLPRAYFERRYLDAHVTTALDPSTTSAEEGSLHEVEFISPYNPVKPDKTEQAKPTRIRSWVFLDDNAMSLLGEESKWRKWLGDLQIGGERRYGFVMLRMVDMKPVNDLMIYLSNARPRQTIPKGEPLLAHTIAAPNIQVRGQIEPLVGRATSQTHAFGSDLTPGIVCWTPGSVPMDNVQVQYEPEGHWRVV